MTLRPCSYILSHIQKPKGYRQSIQVVLKENFGHVTSSHNLYKALHPTIQSTKPPTQAAPPPPSQSAATSIQLNPVQQLQQQLQQQQQIQQLQQLQQFQQSTVQTQVNNTNHQIMSQQQIQLHQLQLQQLHHQLLQQSTNLNTIPSGFGNLNMNASNNGK